MSETEAIQTPLHEQPDVYSKRWFILAIMCLSLIMVVMAVAGLNVALPTIQGDLAASGTELLWIVDSYAIVFAGFLLVAGAMGDKWGRKGALQAGLVVFALGALTAVVAEGAIQVIVGRTIMGAGAAFIMPATLSIITTVFPPEERTKAIAIWAGLAGAGGAIGPIVSGILLTGWAFLPEFWWGSTFLVNVPVIVAVLIVVTIYIPKSRESKPQPLDPVGGALSIGAIAAVLYAIIEGPEMGWLSGTVLSTLGAGVALAIAFVVWELRAEHPMLPMNLFQIRPFSVGSSVIALSFFVMFGFFLLQTLYLQFVLDYDALGAGVATLPLAASLVVVAPRTAVLSDRFGTGAVMGAGFGFMAAGLLMLTTASTTTTYGVIAVAFVLLGIGLALATAPATGGIMTSVPLDKAGVGSAMNDTTRELGGALGIAVGGSVVATFYASSLNLPTTGLAPEAVEAANESIGAAYSVAASIGGDTGAELVLAAQEAFASAFANTMLLGAVIAAVAGVAAWWTMRPRRAQPSQALSRSNETPTPATRTRK